MTDTPSDWKYRIVCYCSENCRVHYFEKLKDAVAHADNRDEYPQAVFDRNGVRMYVNSEFKNRDD